MLLLDYCKAFNKVDHIILLRRLFASAVPDCVTRWFASFLHGLQQHTQIGDSVSDRFPVNAGVLQGMLFGPVGFIIYINDLHICLPTCTCVDDCTLWEVCSTDAADSQPSALPLKQCTGPRLTGCRLTVRRPRSYWCALLAADLTSHP